ncbi:hypothetical protein Hanom_Chr02g00150311 [Helianthus anomalus]
MKHNVINATRIVFQFEWMLLGQDMHHEKCMDKFRKNMQARMYGNEKLFDLRSFDMVLFSILEAGHFYLIEMFLYYLEEVNHPRGLVIKGLEIKRKKLDWAMSGNDTDCGIFLMWTWKSSGGCMGDLKMGLVQMGAGK